MTRPKKSDEPATQDAETPPNEPQDGATETGANTTPPAPAEVETPAYLLSDGLEMPAAGGSYVRQPDGTLTLNTADEAIAARKDDDA